VCGGRHGWPFDERIYQLARILFIQYCFIFMWSAAFSPCTKRDVTKEFYDHKYILMVFDLRKNNLSSMVMRIQSYWIPELNIEAGHQWWSVFPFPVYTFFLMHDVYFVWTQHIWFIFFFFFNLSIPGVVVIDLLLLLTFYTLLFNHAFKLVMCVCVCVCVCTVCVVSSVCVCSAKNGVELIFCTPT
jgi:hypothetical protein